MISNNSMKSWRWYGSSLDSAARRPASSEARIISRMAMMRCGSKNMCSVRQRPMPSAPNWRAVEASSGVSALARTFIVRTASTHSIRTPKSPVSSGWIVGTAPSMTSPVPPSRVMTSPSLTTSAPHFMVLAA